MKKTATKSLQGATRSSMLQPSMATPISWQQSLRLRQNCYAVKTRKMKPLHIAANEGHAEVVRVLLACIEDHNTNEKLTRMTDASGDTALHKAVRSQHLDVVKLLAKEDSEFEFPPNHAQETPLYLDAESGFRDALIIILESCKKQTYDAGPSNRTPLHAAVIQEHEAT
ncbi:putative ankyrin repeat-containing protein-like [Capsicum annuum]|uniref:ankyrin repeat-containing protein ITN1-like n=1 Tax=Capsicum annuum TaxID=4072 RepID=UPI001FB097A5|nr:ankyrin repeat-containing protein ITN1-like [Capsicum annuum]KAF3665158.1 putative ankyrin repeat-containing protein-like [Capsicum annuum]